MSLMKGAPVTKLCVAFTCVNEKVARAVSAKILHSTTCRIAAGKVVCSALEQYYVLAYISLHQVLRVYSSYPLFMQIQYNY